MKVSLARIIEESIKLELNVSEIYLLFQRCFPEDEDFWWQMALEEKNHAALLRSGKDIFAPREQFPEDMFTGSIRELKKVNKHLQNLRKELCGSAPDRAAAFDIALELEQSAGELHFQQFMNQTDGSPADRIFRKLNRDDKDHVKRIREYMKERGIPLDG